MNIKRDYKGLLKEVGMASTSPNIHWFLHESGKDLAQLIREADFNMRLFAKPVTSVSVQLSNFCDKCCDICYCGTLEKNHRLNDHEVDAVISEVVKSEIPTVCLTDCEPFITLDLIERFAGFPRNFSLDIVTNGYPGRNSSEEAAEMFRLLKMSGWNFGKLHSKHWKTDVNSSLMISCDRFHGDDSLTRTMNTLDGLARVYSGEADVFISYTTPDVGSAFDKDESGNLRDEFLFGIFEAIDKRFDFTTPLDWDKNGDPEIVTTSKELEFRFRIGGVRYIENAIKNLPSQAVLKRVKDVTFKPDRIAVANIDCYGNVCFGGDAHCASGLRFGNIFETPLERLLEEMYMDPLVQAIKLGGVQYLYFLYQQAIPGFEVSSVDKCGLCYTMRVDDDSRERTRAFLKDMMKRDHFFVYHNYIENLDKLFPLNK